MQSIIVKDNKLLFSPYCEIFAADIKIPKYIIHIDFGLFFNQSIDNIEFPPNLETLTLSAKFNQPLDNVKFPESLKKIEMGYYFNQSLQNVKLPPNLKEFVFESRNIELLYNLKFPQSLEILTLKNANKSINDLFFYNKSLSTLKCLQICNEVNYEIDNLPSNLEKLVLHKIEKLLLNLPISLKQLCIFDKNYKNGEELNNIRIPYNCEVIKTVDNFIELI